MGENGFHYLENQFLPESISSVLFPLMTFSTSRKKLSSKLTDSIRDKNLSPITGMKDSFKDAFPLERK